MRETSLIILVAVCCYLGLGAVPSTVNGQQESCAPFQGSCGECIRGGPYCAWCEDPEYFKREQPAKRCDTLLHHKENKCKNMINPKSGSDANTNMELDSTTNVSPQNLTLHLRKGQPAKFNVTMRTPHNFPVDLYYLMDVSGSMFKDMKKITSLGSRIATEMNKITTRFRLGYGTFVDKPVAPYINTLPAIVAHPRFLDDGNLDENSIPAFGYRNMLPLELDTSKFEAKVAAQNISANVDNPEGGMDALVQVVVCHQEIGWVRKEEARRLVVMTTDASYHFAGDGLLGGIVTPNDGQCHLADGEYDASTDMDYPSLGQLREILIENQVVPIFAITQNQKEIYDVVRRFFGNETFAVAAELEADGSNIVTLIREAYEKIAKTQTVSDNSTEGITISYRAICPDGTYENTAVCSDVKIGEKVAFEVSVTAEECSDKMPKRVHLRTAFGEVELNLEYICGCQCDKLEYHDEQSITCSYNGSLVCGKCKCDEGWTGRICNCVAGTEGDRTKCPKNNATGKTCSERGKCVCGECICSESKNVGEVFYGDHCQCSNTDCPRDRSDRICGGPEQGKCDCGKCHCYGNWTGPDCSCTREVDGCIENGVLCSGRGECQCGKCVCNATLPYIGTYCDDCPSCASCADNRDCVQCRAFGTGPLQYECETKCSKEVMKVIVVDDITDEMGKKCTYKDEDDCTFAFAYRSNEEHKLEVFVQRERVCPGEVGALVVILGVIFGILAVGLALLLIWKLLATIQDRREFAKFEKERSQAKWDTGENPIFKQATTTFQNPTYKQA